MTINTSTIASLVPSTITPGRFAIRVSRGRWRPARHLLAIDRAIMDAIRGRAPRILVIEAPPRHGKSELVSKYLPAWYLGTHPDQQVLLAGYEAGFARSWGRRARELLEEWGRELFGITVRDDLRAANDWGIAGHEGGMLTAGAGGPLTGRGAHLLIIDDPVKNSEEAHSETIRDKLWDWWQSTAFTRLEPTGCAIVIATRWHNDDLSGRLIAHHAGSTEGIARLHLPALAEEHDALGRRVGEALWPERWPVARLRDTQSRQSDAWWQAMYQQNPGRGTHVIWPEDYFPEAIWTADWPSRFDAAVVGCDFADGGSQGDYSAAVFVGRVGNTFWVDAVIERTPPENFVGLLLALAGERRAQAVVIEKNMFHALLRTEIHRQLAGFDLRELDLQFAANVIPKELRLLRLGLVLRRKQFLFCDNRGGRELVRQLREFPVGRHDDGPDALELALRSLLPAAPQNDPQQLPFEGFGDP